MAAYKRVAGSDTSANPWYGTWELPDETHARIFFYCKSSSDCSVTRDLNGAKGCEDIYKEVCDITNTTYAWIRSFISDKLFFLFNLVSRT
jgi:hypothetical protein